MLKISARKYGCGSFCLFITINIYKCENEQLNVCREKRYINTFEGSKLKRQRPKRQEHTN